MNTGRWFIAGQIKICITTNYYTLGLKLPESIITMNSLSKKKEKIELLMVTFNSYLIIIWIKIPPNVIFRHLSKIIGPLCMVFNSENLVLRLFLPWNYGDFLIALKIWRKLLLLCPALCIWNWLEFDSCSQFDYLWFPLKPFNYSR